MKYVLRNKNTGQYLKRLGLWVTGLEDAITFGDSAEAREYCQAHQIDDVQLTQRLMPYLTALLSSSRLSVRGA